MKNQINYLFTVSKISILLLSILSIESSSFGGEKSPIFLIPKKLHFVWMGKKLPQEYLNNIRSFVSRNPDYEANLWIDKQNSFENPNSIQDVGSLPIKIRKLDDAIAHLPKELKVTFEKERSGVFPNFAAASDIVRVQILIDEGGIYFDTDVFMKESRNPTHSNRYQLLNYPSSQNDFSNADSQLKSYLREKISHFDEIEEEIEVVNTLIELFNRKVVELKHIQVNFTGKLQIIPKLTMPSFSYSSSTGMKKNELGTLFKDELENEFLAPVTRLGDIYAPFGFLFNVETRPSFRITKASHVARKPHQSYASAANLEEESSEALENDEVQLESLEDEEDIITTIHVNGADSSHSTSELDSESKSQPAELVRRESQKITGYNNNVMAAVKNSYFLKQIQKRMILLQKYYEDYTSANHSQDTDGNVTLWSSPLWIYKRYDPKNNSRFDLTIKLTGPGVVRDAAHIDVFPYLEMLPVESVDLIAKEFPELVKQTSPQGVVHMNSARFIHGKYFFIPIDRLMIHGFKFNVPGFQDKCDNSWTQDKIKGKKKLPSEWH